MYKTVFLAIVLMLATTGKAQTTGQEELLNEIRSIKQSLDELRADVAKLREEVKNSSTGNEFDFEDSGRFVSRGANIKKLRAIQFPQEPTEETLRQYIDEILLASRGQNSSSSEDPQVGMLCKVGSEHLDLLLDSMGSTQGIPDSYLVQAISRLAREEHKTMILDALPLHHGLIDAVTQRGWASDARDILLDELESNPPYLPVQWLRAVAELNDPTTYPLLTSYFINGNNRYWTYEAIRNLPIPDMASCVSQAWERSKFADEYESKSMARIAAEYGQMDALDDLIAMLNEEDEYNRHNAMESRTTLLRLLDFRGANDELVQWYNANKGRLVFDPARKKYVVQ